MFMRNLDYGGFFLGKKMLILSACKTLKLFRIWTIMLWHLAHRHKQLTCYKRSERKVSYPISLRNRMESITEGGQSMCHLSVFIPRSMRITQAYN